MPPRCSSAVWSPILGFTVFGAFWGAWGASIPAIRDQAALSDADLGTALLAIAAGAIPAMIVMGKTYDRWGGWVAFVAMAALAAMGALTAWLASGLLSLVILLALVGAASGAADVAITALAGTAQRGTGQPVLLRAYGMFSVAVVVSSLVTGFLLEHGLGPATGFVAVLVLAIAVGALVSVGPQSELITIKSLGNDERSVRRAVGWRRLPRLQALLLLGGLGALASAIENAHQSWGAVFLTDELGAGPLVAAIGPAAFAGTTALVRLGLLASPKLPPAAVVVSGALLTAAGTLLLATASSVAIGLTGLVLAAMGTATPAPTLISLLTELVPDNVRGSATSVVSGVAYLGYLAGPVYVGTWSGAMGLSAALAAVAGLGVVLATLAGLSIPSIGRQGTNPAKRAVGFSFRRRDVGANSGRR